MDGLMQRVSVADEGEFAEMPLEKVGHLIASFSRNEAAERKIELEAKTKMNLAFGQLENEVKMALQRNPKLSDEFYATLEKVKNELTIVDTE